MRIMTITMEVNDEEAKNLLNRFAERGAVTFEDDDDDDAQPSTPSAPSTGAEVDVNGVPWNERFHAKTKTKTNAGVWKAAKGMDDATKAEAEQYAAQFSNPTPAPPAAEATAPTPPAPPAPPAAPAATTPPAPPAAPVMPVAPVAPTPPAPVSYEDLTTGFTETIARVGQPVVMANLAQIYANAGVDAAGESLQTNETQRAQVLAAIRAL